MTVFEAEAAAELEQTRRRGLVALADYLTGLDDYPDPWDLFAAFCPGVPREQVERWASALLHVQSRKVRDEHWREEILDALTGVR